MKIYSGTMDYSNLLVTPQSADGIDHSNLLGTQVLIE